MTSPVEITIQADPDNICQSEPREAWTAMSFDLDEFVPSTPGHESSVLFFEDLGDQEAGR